MYRHKIQGGMSIHTYISTKQILKAQINGSSAMQSIVVTSLFDEYSLF